MTTQVVGYPTLNRTMFMDAMRPYFTETEMKNIEAAYFFSKYAHRGQYRDDGVTRYFDHPRAVAWILFNEFHIHDWRVIVIALLHDMIEDSFIMTEDRLEINFGREVTLGVRYMTHDKAMTDDMYWHRFHEVENWLCLVNKLGDRLHNLRTLYAVTREKQIRKLDETRRCVFPLFAVAERLVPEIYLAAVRELSEVMEDLVVQIEEDILV